MRSITRRNFVVTTFGAFLAFSLNVKAQPNLNSHWNYRFDVVVIGAGASGLTAATRLAQAGKKVLLVEKLPFTGGSTLFSGGGFAVPCSKFQIEKNIKDSPQTYYEDMMRAGGFKNDPEVVRAVTTKALDAFNWVLGNGGKLRGENVSKSGSVPRNMLLDTPTTVKALTNSFVKAGGTLWLSSPAKELLWDEKMHRISGVLIEHDKKKCGCCSFPRSGPRKRRILQE